VEHIDLESLSQVFGPMCQDNDHEDLQARFVPLMIQLVVEAGRISP
jgi:hypothetical protein